MGCSVLPFGPRPCAIRSGGVFIPTELHKQIGFGPGKSDQAAPLAWEVQLGKRAD